MPEPPKKSLECSNYHEKVTMVYKWKTPNWLYQQLGIAPVCDLFRREGELLDELPSSECVKID